MWTISIHAPLAGCDVSHHSHPTPNFRFQSTHPLRGATAPHRTATPASCHFNPRTPCGVRRRCTTRGHRRSRHFNPRTPCGVRHKVAGARDDARNISIHAPLAGCDQVKRRCFDHRIHFNPRTPCGVRQRSRAMMPKSHRHFNPRTPCGVRPAQQVSRPRSVPFQSTHPLRGATAKAHKKMRHFCAKGINTSSLCAKNAHPAT